MRSPFNTFRKTPWCVAAVAATYIAGAPGCRTASNLRRIHGTARTPDLAYVLTVQETDPRTIRIELAASGSSDGLTTFAIEDQWGGVNDNGRSVHNFVVRDHTGRELPHDHPTSHQWTVAHQPGQPLTCAYTLRGEPDRLKTQNAGDYRPILSDDLIHFFGHNALVYPEHLEDSPLRINLDCRGAERKGWNIVSSFGSGQSAVSVQMKPSEFRHTAWSLGKLRLHERTYRGARLGIALYGDSWRFRDEEFVNLAARIVRAERDFFDDHRDPWYLITLIPVGEVDPNSFSIGGTALTNAFALFVTPGVSLERGSPGASRMKRLLAHEYFHRWNGGNYQPAEPEEALYWFSEGFTEFFARRILLRAGLVSPTQFAEDLNESMKTYHLSPANAAPNESIVSGFWTDRDLRELPYRRGDLLALCIDARIRQVSRGKRSLDNMARDLLATRSQKPELSNEWLFTAIANATDARFADAVRSCVVSGTALPLPPALQEPPLVRSMRAIRAFDLGFDESSMNEPHQMAGVRPDSAAFRAGLRNGQRLRGWSIQFGDATKEVELTVENGGVQRTVRYLPAGNEKDIPFYLGAARN